MKKQLGIVLLLLLFMGSSIGSAGGAATTAAPTNLTGNVGQWLPASARENLQLFALSESLQLRNGVEAIGAPTAVPTAEPTAEATPEATAQPAQTPPTPAQLENFYEHIWQLVGATYYNPAALTHWGEWEHKFDGKLNTIEELEAALQQMVASIGDHWTSYTPYAERVKSYNQFKANVVDLGMMLKLENDAYRVWYVEWGSVAWAADIRRGDIITSIAGTKITNKTSQDEVDALLMQAQGTKVTVVDEHGSTTEKIELTAAAPATPAVESHLEANGIAYIRFPNFDDPNLLDDFVTQLKAMYDASAPKHFSALVIDLRGNPGGLGSEAVNFVSAFMQKGIVMSQLTRQGRLMTTSQLSVVAPDVAGGQPSEFGKFVERVPLYLLVDENSASAAEVTAGGFKDNHRAILIGNTTWGKGVGYIDYDQQSGPYATLPTGGLLQITVEGLRTPNGSNVQGRGIRPDVFIYQPRGHKGDIQLQSSLRYVAAAMAGH